MIWASVLGGFSAPPSNRVRKWAATWELVLPARPPNRFGKFVASQLPSAVAVEPPLKLLIRFWPLGPCQKPTVAVWLAPIGSLVSGGFSPKLYPVAAWPQQ